MKLSEKDIIKQNRFAKLVYEYIDSKDESVTKRIVKVCDNVSSDEKDRLVKMGNVLNNLMKVLHVSIDELHYEKYNYIPLCHEDINIVIGPLMDNLHEEGACNVFFFGFDKNERIVSLIDDMDKISKCKHYYAFKDSILNCSKELNIFLTNYAKYVIEYESSKTSLDFTNNEIALVLGAGCSIDAHICNWYDLCYSLSYELLVEKENYGLNNFGTKNINDAILSELFKSYDKNTVIDISKGHNKNKSFNNSIDYFKSIHDALYLNYDDCCDYNTDLMKAISECILKNKISEVITFNFDNILEKNLNSNYKSTKDDILTSTISIGNENNIVKIYHVHGFVPFDYDGVTNVNNFILSDKDFLKNIDSNDFCNSVQKRIYNEKDVVFIGCSFNDINLRSILQNLSVERTNKLYAIVKTPNFDMLSEKIKEKKVAIAKYKMIVEQYYNEINVIPIWINDFNEIGEVISSIDKSTK